MSNQPRLSRLCAILGVCLLCVNPATLRAADATDWLEFRGPHGNGHATAKSAPLRWSKTEGVRWRTDLPGRAWSSPVVKDGVVYLTTAIEQQGDGKTKTPKSVDLRILAVDFASGELLRNISLINVDSPESIHSLNSYASPTPVIAGDRIVCHFGAFGTVCLTLPDLNEAWRKTLTIEHGVGPGSSPVVEDGRLILICDGMDEQYVTALDIETGETLWKTDRPPMDTDNPEQMKSYCTPVFATDSAGRRQLICLGAQWMVSYDPASGEEFWRFKHGGGYSIVPRPVLRGDALFFSTGYNKPALKAIGIGGSGDVTKSQLKWTEKKSMPAKPSPLLVGSELYVISDNGVATCFDAESGAVHWRERVGGNYSASPLLVGGHIYFASHEGTVTVINAGTEYTEVAKNEMDESLMASPIAIGGDLLIRSADALYRVSGSAAD